MIKISWAVCGWYSIDMVDVNGSRRRGGGEVKVERKKESHGVKRRKEGEEGAKEDFRKQQERVESVFEKCGGKVRLEMKKEKKKKTRKPFLPSFNFFFFFSFLFALATCHFKYFFFPLLLCTYTSHHFYTLLDFSSFKFALVCHNLRTGRSYSYETLRWLDRTIPHFTSFLGGAKIPVQYSSEGQGIIVLQYSKIVLCRCTL